MKIAPFETEHFFAKYEFNTPHQLCNSDCDTMNVDALMEMAGCSLADFGKLDLGYTESRGNPNFREALSKGYEEIKPDDFLILGTPVEGIYLTARAVLQHEDEVIVLTPAYDALVNMFEHVVSKERVKKWALAPTADGWSLDLDALKSLITPRTKLVVVNFPHNPTGYLPTPEWLQDLIEIVEANNLWLFCDEMYFGLIHSGTPAVPSAAELSDRAIVLSGLSKTYGLPGLRSGWLVVRDECLRESLLNWKFYTSICPPAPTEFLAMAAWKVREQLRDRSVKQIEQNLDLATAFFERWPDLFTWRPPMAGSVALVGIDVPSVDKLSAKLVESHGVLLQSGAMLGADDQSTRIGFGREGFGKALEVFEVALSSTSL